MDFHTLVEAIIEENRTLLSRVSTETIDDLVQWIDRDGRIFCAAQGRSGFILRCFCMRLMQLGYPAFFVGETITPRIGKGDALFVLSGSGQTALTQDWVMIAKEQGADTFGIVGSDDSPIGKILDHNITLAARSKLGSSEGLQSSQPAGSLFEQGAFLLLETIILALYQRGGSDPRIIQDRHANLE